MKKVDLETVMLDIQAVLAGRLNTKLDEINDEKDDAIVLKHIDPNAYFIQDVNNDAHINFDPFVYMGVEEVEAISIGPATGKVYTIPVVIVLADNGQDLKLFQRIYRYSRALEEVFEENWDTMIRGTKGLIKSLAPIAWMEQNSSQSFKAVGVILQIGIG